MQSDEKVVIVEPDSASLARLVALFDFMQFETVAYPAVDAIPLGENDQLDWVAIKLGHNNSEGAMRELLTRLRTANLQLPVLHHSGQQGADMEDYVRQFQLELPLNHRQLAAKLLQAREFMAARRGQGESAWFPLGGSPAMQVVRRLAARVAPHSSTVLLLAELGRFAGAARAK